MRALGRAFVGIRPASNRSCSIGCPVRPETTFTSQLSSPR